MHTCQPQMGVIFSRFFTPKQNFRGWYLWVSWPNRCIWQVWPNVTVCCPCYVLGVWNSLCLYNDIIIVYCIFLHIYFYIFIQIHIYIYIFIFFLYYIYRCHSVCYPRQCDLWPTSTLPVHQRQQDHQNVVYTVTVRDCDRI